MAKSSGKGVTWFKRQSRLVQIILLLIPIVNWVVEIIVRWSTFFQKGGAVRLVICIVVTFLGLFVGWIDCIWVLVTKHLFLQ